MLANKAFVAPASTRRVALVRAQNRRPVVQVKAIFGSATKPSGSMYDYEVKDIDGKAIKLDKFKGKVTLVVNLASACGFTKQYKDLQQVYDKYQKRGFTILGFPCNQFGGQESGSNSQIKQFAQSNYGVTFPLMAKVDVNGGGADPVFNFLKESKGGLLGNDIKWNFSKFLVDKEGKVVGRYPSTTEPAAIASDIEKYL